MRLNELRAGLDSGEFGLLTTSLSKCDGAIDIRFQDGFYEMVVWVWESIDPGSSPIAYYSVYFSQWDDLVYNVSRLTSGDFFGIINYD